MREDEFDLRWIRPGWFDQDRPCDRFVIKATELLPGQEMPQRWGEKRPGIWWCKTMSYHRLMIDGTDILRIWTNARKTTSIDVNTAVANGLLEADFEVSPVPAGTFKRRPEFGWRFRLNSVDELVFLMALVRSIYLWRM